jgi:hypothetical protein
MSLRMVSLASLAVVCTAVGCQSPYAADRGAAFGAGAGAAAGAVIAGAAGKNALAGAAIGAMGGAITGAVVGDAIDEQEARNRAAIEAQMGRRIRAGSVTMDDVIAMTKSGVADELIVNHIRGNGMIAPPSAQDLIVLNQQGVTPRVVQAMQAPPPQQAQQVTHVVHEAPPPVVVERHYWGGPRYYHHHPHCYPRNRTSYGFSFSSGH